MVSLLNASGALVAAGTPVYNSAAGSFSKAIATALATAVVIGLAAADIAIGASGNVQTSDTITLTTAQWDAAAGTVGGLAFGQPYYLDVTAGKLTAAAPTTVGQFATLIGYALSTTQLRLLIQPPIGL